MTKGKTCETNKYGEMKMHYCDKMYGAGSSACITDEPPPIEEECKELFSYQDTKKAFDYLKKEIRIEDESGKAIAFCYPSKNQENENYGWCRTKGQLLSPWNL